VTIKNRTFLLLGGALAAGFLFAAVSLYVRRAGYFTEARSVFAGFVKALAAGDYQRAQQYTAEGILVKAENGKWRVHALNCEIDAAEFTRAKIRRVNRRYGEGDQVIFELTSREDDAVVVNSRIVSFKLP
jgi:hypothetical protein